MATTIVTGLPTDSLTQVMLDGTGVFDVLMRANKMHLEEAYQKGRITGTEYSTVYLGSLDAVLNAALQYVLQKEKVASEIALLEAQTDKVLAEQALVEQQRLNAVEEGKVLVAQENKLNAEVDVLAETRLKTVEETTLLNWKTTTEKAQTLAAGVDEDSIVGKQKALYGAQATGFVRDAEQKVAKLLVDTWNVRRTTDEATVADGVNMLNDVTVGRAVNKLLAGVGA